MEKFKYKKIEQKANKFVFEVTAEYSLYEEYEQKAFATLAKKVKLPGFRPGKAPKDMIEGEIATKVFNSAINNILPDLAEEVIMTEKLSPLSHLHYDLKEIDKEKGVIFQIEFLTHPDIDPSAFTKIKVEEPKTEVSEEEILGVIKNMVLNNIPADKIKFKEPKKTAEDKKEEAEPGHEGHNHTTDQEKDFDLTDELVTELKYEDEKTVESLKAKVKEALTSMKKQQSEEQYTAKLVEEAIKLSDFEVPHEMLDGEVEQMENDFKTRLKQIKLDIDGYLKTQGTTLEQMQEQWRKDAEARISTDLLLINLAVKENLMPSEEELDAEIDKMEDPKVKVQYKTSRNRDYLKTLLTRQRGLTKLMDIVKTNAK